MFEGVGDNGDGEMSFFYVKEGEADTVEANGAFFDEQCGELFREGKAEFPTAPFFLSILTGGGTIDMSLDDMTVDTPVHDQASFQVDEVARLPIAEIGLFEGLVDGGDLVDAIPGGLHGETSAVVGDALVWPQFVGNGGCDLELPVTSMIIN